MSIEVVKLTPNIAAEIKGVDLRNFDASETAQIRKAFLEHGVIVFRDQFLTPEQHVAFAKSMGEVMVYEGYKPFDDLPTGMFRFTNDGKEKVITEHWHFDGTYYDVPPAAGILAPQKVPDVGGDTMWSNQYVTYDRLSDGMKKLLSGLWTECVSHRSSRKYNNELMSATQPAIRKHPETGRLSLNIGHPDTCVRFLGMTEEESRPLIHQLHAITHDPDNVYRHQWRLGDVVMWDNRCTMHYAIHDYGMAEREMYRMTILGDRPQGPLGPQPAE